jgi:DNA-binding CsgD family transcriptional regulator
VDPLSPSDSPELTQAFFADVHARVAAGDPAFRFLGMTGTGARALAELLAQVQTSAWNMQRMMNFHAMKEGRGLTDDARRRGVEFRVVVSPSAPVLNPVHSSYSPDLRVGPVGGPMLVLDGRHVVVPGFDGDSIWVSSDARTVEHGIRAYKAVWALSHRVVPEGEDPPLTPRMMDVAWLLADGASDRVISRELGISERTVSAEVREIGRRLGASNRARTIARICGAPV